MLTHAVTFEPFLMLNGMSFVLTGVVERTGLDTTKGHYVAFVLENGKWWRLADAKSPAEE